MFTTIRDFDFWDDVTRSKITAKAGIRMVAMSRSDINNMAEPGPYIRARQKYRDRGEDGVFLMFNGKYRWFSMEGLKRG